jgi:HNH endonuclease
MCASPDRCSLSITMDAGPASVKSTTCSLDRQTFTGNLFRTESGPTLVSGAGPSVDYPGGPGAWTIRCPPHSVPNLAATRPTPAHVQHADTVLRWRRRRDSVASFERSLLALPVAWCTSRPSKCGERLLTLPLPLMQTRGGRYRWLGSPSRRQAVSSSSRRQLVPPGAHIRPLGGVHAGPDAADNMLCLCANCHVRFDRSAIHISSTGQVIETATSAVLGSLRTAGTHSSYPAHVDYHRTHIALRGP